MARKMISIRFSMSLPAVVTKKEKWYLAECSILDISSQGSTEDEAKKQLSEAIAVFLISCHERGTLDTVLKNCGFTPDLSGIKNYDKANDLEDYGNVGLPFVIDIGTSHKCHA